MHEKQKKIIYTSVIALILIAIDQILKTIIPKEEQISIIKNILNINFVKNTGAAFGIGSSNTVSFIIVSIIIIIIIIRFFIMHAEKMNKLSQISLSIILAGGISNLIDRIFKGYVVDYIDITQVIKFPIFNIADIYIVLGWILFVIATLKGASKKEEKGKEEFEGVHNK